MCIDMYILIYLYCTLLTIIFFFMCLLCSLLLLFYFLTGLLDGSCSVLFIIIIIIISGLLKHCTCSQRLKLRQSIQLNTLNKYRIHNKTFKIHVQNRTQN